MHFFQLIKGHPKAVKRSIALISSLLYFASIVTVSLIFTKYCRQDPNPAGTEFWHGFDILVWGPLALMRNFKPAIGWLGNFFGAMALLAYLRSRYKAALIWTLISLSVSWLGIDRLWVKTFAADEGGVCHLLLLKLGIGCWLWLGAQIVIGVGSIVMLSFFKELTKKSSVSIDDKT